ncbi:MAG TPA: response regulator, partial [Baekduia sp.]|nr:response regulator [Baekduia sp.]
MTTVAPLQPRVLVVAGGALAAAIEGPLRCSGADVLRCADLPSAVRTLRRGPCAVVVADLDLPGAGGVPAVHRLVAEAPATDVVAVTASPDASLHERVRRAGALDVLVKGPALADRLQRVLTAARRRCAATTLPDGPAAPAEPSRIAEVVTVGGVTALAVAIGTQDL